jgi:uncharacterized protein YdaU (DUF1376 family)
MPVYIGDYLADTMHLSTEQHGAYLLLLFHLWRRGILHDDDASLGQITGLSKSGWSSHRPVLAAFFEIRDGLWHHGRVERERTRVSAKQHARAEKAKLAASRRWSKPPVQDAGDASSIANALRGDASSIPDALPGGAKSESESESELLKTLLSEKRKHEPQIPALRLTPVERTPSSVSDPRHTCFRIILGEYWRAKNHASPEMPWQGRDAKALSDFLAASPKLSEMQFRQMLGNRAKSAVAHGDRVYLWIANLTRFQEEITVYNKPASAGGGHASRAEINRDSVVSAVDRALALAREHADRAGQAGPEQTGFPDAGMSVADGAGPDRCALAIPGDGDHRMAAGNATDGQAGTDGSVSYGPTAAVTGNADRVGGEEVIAW